MHCLSSFAFFFCLAEENSPNSTNLTFSYNAKYFPMYLDFRLRIGEGMYSRISRRRHRLPEQWPRVGAVISAGASMTKQTGTFPHCGWGK